MRGARENNLKNIDVTIPLGKLVAITGASGSGKSTLVNEILYKALWKKLEDTRTLPGEHDGVDGIEHVHKVVSIDQTPIGRNSRSNPATYIGFYDAIRDLFTNAPLAIERDYRPGRFSFNVKGGRCEECQGEGVITTQLYFMPDVEVTCAACKGARFNSETLEVTIRGKTIDDVLNMSVEEGVAFFATEPALARKIEILNDLGLGYLTLGQSATTLSGGEAQRIKIATELGKLQRSKHTVYILDEPTTGLHLADVERLLVSLNQLVDAGHTVILIEHHMDVIKTADHVIDLGPGRRTCRRSRRRRGHARAGGALQGVAHRAVSQAAPQGLTGVSEAHLQAGLDMQPIPSPTTADEHRFKSGSWRWRVSSAPRSSGTTSFSTAPRRRSSSTACSSRPSIRSPGRWPRSAPTRSGSSPARLAASSSATTATESDASRCSS